MELQLQLVILFYQIQLRMVHSLKPSRILTLLIYLPLMTVMEDLSTILAGRTLVSLIVYTAYNVLVNVRGGGGGVIQ